MIKRHHPLAAAALLCCGGFASLVLPLPVHAATEIAGDVSEVRLPQSREWTMRATGSGREYRIFVALPDGPEPEDGYTTIYVLDGNAMFLTTAEAVHDRAPP
jgi:hypothetical protein